MRFEVEVPIISQSNNSNMLSPPPLLRSKAIYAGGLSPSPNCMRCLPAAHISFCHRFFQDGKACQDMYISHLEAAAPHARLCFSIDYISLAVRLSCKRGPLWSPPSFGLLHSRGANRNLDEPAMFQIS